MSSTPHDHDDDHDAEPVTDHVHDNSWSANLEKPKHGDDRELVLRQAIEAVEHTAAGNHVNLVTHGDHGHPSEYLFEELDAELDEDADWEYVEQCGCGGHVTRVHV
ncbi:CGCGG family putative rSAM-modified RiPP protein [Halomicrobium urmianum]|uniref:CGCGG family putative rSAM-modified RiPP protein n=1 Tax=Halomicrobium urmianum TaxID=1586233 RepID=UPI001CD92AEB|nr:CGCGG family rSAM-modified RiPP protein [Halomicrobium urmianum]